MARTAARSAVARTRVVPPPELVAAGITPPPDQPAGDPSAPVQPPIPDNQDPPIVDESEAEAAEDEAEAEEHVAANGRDEVIPKGYFRNRRGVLKRLPPPLPPVLPKAKFEPSLNDLVHEAHIFLYDHDAYYKSLLEATYDVQAVEGSLAADNTLAAKVIRDYAIKAGGILERLGREKLASIVNMLGVVLRRYHLSRKERRYMVGGQQVPPDNGND